LNPIYQRQQRKDNLMVPFPINTKSKISINSFANRIISPGGKIFFFLVIETNALNTQHSTLNIQNLTLPGTHSPKLPFDPSLQPCHPPCAPVTPLLRNCDPSLRPCNPPCAPVTLSCAIVGLPCTPVTRPAKVLAFRYDITDPVFCVRFRVCGGGS
jgi:hypothetical protein